VSVEVRLPTLLRRHADNRKTLETSGTTLQEVFDDVRRQYPDLGAQLVGADGDLHKFMNVYVNDDDVRFTGKLQTAVKDGDSVTLLPAVAGG
jgi:sulfur-carrier protein